jgi:FtsP/CotA-like multicopper oxidase with cupredoxin domain
MQLVYRSEVPFNSKTAKLPKSPMMRDTIEISPMGYLVLRFKADNAGVSLCKYILTLAID